MNKETFKELLGDWFIYLEKWIESKDCYNIYQVLQKDSIAGIKIFPYYDSVFRFFKETNPSDLKLVLLGNEPYPGQYWDNKLPHTTGISFDNSNCTKDKLQPSLIHFWEGIANEYNEEVEKYLQKDLTFLCKQGVLLGNRSLTVQKDKIASYKSLWDSLWLHLFTEIFPTHFQGVPVILLGKDTHKLKSYVFNMTNPLFMIEHPSHSARQGQLWKTENVFKKIDNYLKQTNNYKINWKL